jgi:alkanesulfonate monooxygenase SsuD/methylene tetrahydromethanopterin reductase-like flavin-dependent oxidoreductase (luciferase family)
MGSFGLTLANRGVIIGAVTVPQLFDMARRGEDSGAFEAVWVGDSLLAKPRLESIALLSALAAITKKVRLAVGCMATFPHRHPALLAQQWASLDVISNGRAWLAVCLGGPNEQSPAQALEHRVMGIKDTERVGRLEEGITILRKLFHEEKASHKGRFYEFEGVTIEPRPLQNPMPIWIASNPTGLTWRDGASAPDAAVERGLRRVARFADGWMTNKVTPEEFKSQWTRIRAMAKEEGRDPAKLGTSLYHNININEDRKAALNESKAFLDKYYTANFSMKFVEGFTTAGSPKQCTDELKAYFAAGLNHITLRMTSWDQTGQLRRFLEDVVPAFQ